ncbi:hypothetical protein MKZ38_004346 [Zalerion maritima]|uniref:Major facilitator superfamily (MFS) profile domain-containing protein n=1 Tax=Zalerion maritima TaxID=339359 RepID=A0AAD5RLE8_9PEZI|nr:hypothetical protein MKZ38_004346 [Zalerion maritima]
MGDSEAAVAAIPGDKVDASALPSEKPSQNGVAPHIDGTASASPSNEASPDEMTVSPRGIYGTKWILVVVALLSSFVLYALDTTIVATVQPRVVNAFGGVDLVPWLSVSFALASAATTLPWSKAYGTFSAKTLYLAGTTLFMAGSALCGAAPNINAFIIGRAIAGVGGTGMYMGMLTILSVSTTNTERPQYLSLTGFFWGIGTVLGPVVGGSFSESAATWRWAFYLNLCVGAAASPIYLLLLPNPEPQAGVAMLEKLAQIDFLGALLSIGAFLCIMLAMNFGGVLWDWDAGRSIGTFVTAGVLCIAFVFQQLFSVGTSVEHRMFPMHFWKSRTMIVLFLTMMFAAFGCFISIYYLPLYYQFSRGATAVETSVHMLPFIMFLVVCVLINGRFMGKTGYYYPWYIFGSVMELVGGVLLYTVDEFTSNAKIYGYTIILGTGVGCFCQAGFPVAQMQVKPEDIPYSVGFMTVSQMIGITLGTGISGALFVNQAQDGLAKVFPNATSAEISDAVAGVGSQLIESAIPAVRAEAIHLVTNAIQLAYIPIIAAGSISLVCSVLMKREKVF